jgi:molybdopterin-containing oxidoreductase family iron-sulfur binding subunit
MKRLPIVYAKDLSGRQYWRSLAEQQNDPEYLEAKQREFPAGADEAPPEGDVSRRGFMGIMGAAMALAGMTACRRPEEKIVPYARAPEEVVPGNPLFYATAFPWMGSAIGLLVETHEGRPTKIEGNPLHPDSLGATNTYAQAIVLDLYDPDRSDSPRVRGNVKKSWDDAAVALRDVGAKLKADGGKGLAILTPEHRSPSLEANLTNLKKQLPQARVVRWAPFGRAQSRDGARLAFGKPYDTVRDWSKARVIVTLEADAFLRDGSPVKQARGWAQGRNPRHPAEGATLLNRFYAVESVYSVTGACADHRLRLKPSDVASFAFTLAHQLATAHGADLGEVTGSLAAQRKDQGPAAKKFMEVLAKDLAANKGASLVVAGENLPAEVHAVVDLINLALGNVGDGKPVQHVQPWSEGTQEGAKAVVELSAAINANQIQTLVILGGNPAFDAPTDAKLADAIAKVPTSIHLSTHYDETSALCGWHIPRAHLLESWGDAASEDGTVSIIQPMIAPLYGGKTDLELVRQLLGDVRKGYELVRAFFLQGDATADSEKLWRKMLHDGVLAGVKMPTEDVKPTFAPAAAAVKSWVAPQGVEVTFQPDSHAWDGSFANNGWTQEFPDPMHKTTWGNHAWLSPKQATDMGVVEGDVVQVTVGAGSVKLPVLVAPGMADGVVAVMLGQGRRSEGRVQTGIGIDCYPLRASTGLGFAAGKVDKQGDKGVLARTQEHFNTEGRPLIREGTLDEFKKNPKFVTELVEEHAPNESMWTDRDYSKGHKWGMAIDLNGCIGCGACMIACQAENNIPTVGREGVLWSREMHWIRVDRYYEGTPDEPRAVMQPMPCQQCEDAPCEGVCPVGATAHSPEGLNDMAYNRCIGTRYCANNCPWKVRRFNYFNYQKNLSEQKKMQFNPDVTVRARGVMEKCTFCVQRINQAKIALHREGKERVEDGAVVTACAQVCPTSAITFGDLNDPKAKVFHKAWSVLNYVLLEELNTRPRVSYLAKIRNPHPELETAKPAAASEHKE